MPNLAALYGWLSEENSYPVHKSCFYHEPEKNVK